MFETTTQLQRIYTSIIQVEISAGNLYITRCVFNH
jgi:hypothetical protein